MKEIRFFSCTAFTMKAKSALSKNKLFSLLSYVGAVHFLPNNYKRQVERALLKFLVPFLPSKDMSDIATTHKIVSLAAFFLIVASLSDRCVVTSGHNVSAPKLRS